MSASKARAAKGKDGSAERAAREILAGDPGPTARRWLGPLSVVAFGLFAVITYLVINGATGKGFDLPVAAAAETFPWGPLTYWMTLTNVTGGLIQDVAGAVIIIGLFIYDRRAGYLMALGAIGSLIDQIVKVSLQRHRPTADLVKILDPSTGYSYPSGHAVFFHVVVLHARGVAGAEASAALARSPLGHCRRTGLPGLRRAGLGRGALAQRRHRRVPSGAGLVRIRALAA